MLRSCLLSSCAFFALSAIEGPALAQTPGAGANAAVDEGVSAGDIIVTARRREENVQDVPLSIVAFNQNSLTENAIASAQDLGRAAPGLISVPSSGNPNLVDFSIRGRGLNFGAAAGSVETYFAEVPLSPNFQMPQLPPQFFDVSSVQVLKGPQGTLFGRSTTGGAVLIQPAPATNNWEGYGRAQLGNYNNVQMEGAINIPVIDDKLAVRLAGFHWKRDGYIKLRRNLPASVTSRFSDPAYRGRLFGAGTTFTNGRVLDGAGRVLVDNGQVIAGSTGQAVNEVDYNSKDVTEFRATIRLTPVDGIENSTMVTYHRDKNLGGTSGALLAVRNAVGVPIGTELAPGYSPTDRYVGYLSAPPQRPANHSWALVNTTNIDLTDDLRLRNIFGYIRADGYVLDAYDPDGTIARTIDTYAGAEKHTKQYTDEIQLQGNLLDERLEFTVGALTDNIREPRDPNGLNTASVSGNAALAIDPANPNANGFRTRYLSANVTSRAVYGSVTFKLTDQLSVTGGLRHTWDKVDALQASSLSSSIYSARVFEDANPDIAGFQQTRRLQRKFESNVYNLGVDFQASQDLLVYAGWRHGFKRGGFNSSAFGAFPPSFGPEEIDSFSVGAKTQFDLADMGSVRFNIEGYYDKYKGFQASYLLFAAGNLLTLTTNIPKVRYTGFDADLTVMLDAGLDININYAYLDAKIQRFPDTTTGAVVLPSLEANKITYAAKHQLQASARFHGEADGIGEWVLRPSVSYRSKFYTTLFNRLLPASQRAAFGSFDNLALGGATVEGVTLVDMRAELNEIAGSRFGVALGATNLLNKFYTLGNSGTLAFGIQGNSVGPPRMVYGEVSFRF